MTRIGVDVGGTFTDIVVFDDSTLDFRCNKVKSTPQNPSLGVLQAIEKIGLPLSQVQLFIHGTTYGLNTIIQKKRKQGRPYYYKRLS